MKALWFTVAVLATALAMALAAFPAMGETSPELQAYSQQLQQYYQQQFQLKIAEYQKQLQTQGLAPQAQQDQLKAYQEQLQKQFQDDYAKQMAQAQKQIADRQAQQPAAQAQAQAQTPAPAQPPPQTPPPQENLPKQPDPSSIIDQVMVDKQKDKMFKSWESKPDQEGLAFLGHNLTGMRLSLLGVTPLLMKNSYDAAFKSFGPLALLSFALGSFKRRGYFHGEIGLGAMFSRFVGAAGGFNHTYFDIPVRLRLLYPLSTSVVGEVFAGAVLRPFQYSDNPTLSNGPLFPNRSGVFTPDFGLGLSFPLSSTFRIRSTFGLVYLAFGLEWTFDKSE